MKVSLVKVTILFALSVASKAQDACPPTAKMDAIIALESAYTIGTANWDTMKAFARKVLESFNVSSAAANFGAFKFSDRIYYQNQIVPNDFPNDRAALLAKFDTLNYVEPSPWRRPLADYTFTGTAIRHATRYSLVNGNRRDFKDLIILFVTSDAVDNPKGQADILRQVGGEIIVVAINPASGALNPSLLVDMAGSASNVIHLDNFAALNETASQNLFDKICENAKKEEIDRSGQFRFGG